MKSRCSRLFKALSVALFLCAFNVNSFASHVQGGEITMSCLGGNQYEIKLALYRDCAGINAPGSVSIDYQSTSCGINDDVTLNKIPNTGQDVTPICPTETTACNGGTLPGVQEYIYTAIVTLSDCNDWVFSYSINARNGAISTINNPGSESMYIESKLDNLNFPCNSSPTFTNKPVPFICVGQQYCFNNGATDVDGDSLSYSMVTPQTSATTNVTYIGGNSATQPLSSTPPVTIDPLTGDICMTPSQLEVTVFAVLVSEWRNGIKVGEIRRDIQIRTIICNNSNPFLNGINNTGVYNMNHCIGTPINFNIPSFDNDAGQNVTLTWNNGISAGTFNPGAGANPTAIFSWNPTISDISSTPYCFTVTAADDNCPILGTQSYSFCITVGGFTTSTTSTDVLCNNTDGTASVTPANSASTFTYLWNVGAQTTPAVNNLAAGTYAVTTSDAIGCSITDSITVNSTGSAVAAITSFTNVSCNGSDDGNITATLTGQGLVAPLTYSWNPAVVGNVNTAASLAPGNYSIIITDSQGCTDTVDQLITEPTALTVNTNFVNVGCFGSATGSASANGVGGTGPYSYLWMPGAFNSGSISNLPIGTYTITTTDDNNCMAIDSVTIVEPLPLGITDVVTNANCGQADGSATVTGSGGFAPYTWLWSDGQTNATAVNLAAGTYSVTITDLNFCTKTVSVSVGNNTGPTAQFSSLTDVSCNGGNNGNITATITGGTSPYTFLWNNGQTTPTASNLTVGLYDVTITDDNGCSVAIDTSISEPTPLTNNFVAINPLCFGGATGSITANPLGGTAPYNYSWSIAGNPTATNINNLTSGTYTVTITDDNNCAITQSTTLTDPPTVNTVISATDVQCFNTCDGIAAPIITNGIAPFTYSWNDPLTQTTDTAKFLCPGTYQVNIIDGNGCTSQAVTTINEPTQLNTTISSQGNLECYQECIGFAQVTATGGTAPYTFLWNNGDMTATTTNLCAGSYSCTVTDVNSCTSTVTVTITEPSELIATITATNIKCFGTCDGTGNIAFSGGTAPYTFLWTPGLQTINNPIDLCVGQNVATITDNNGCLVTDTVTLLQSSPILVTAQTLNVSNCGQANGGARVTPSGGTAPYSYVWNNPTVSQTDSIANELAGSYTVDVTDANGCLETVTININDVAGPNVTIDSHTDLLCFGDTNGTANITISAGLAPYIIDWGPGNQTIQNPTNLDEGTHTVTVTDAAGCVTSASVNILEPTDINTVITSNSDVTCFGLCNGNAIVSAIGGTGVLSYLWNDPGAQNTAAATNLCAGNYIVTTSDVNGCTKTNTITITEPDELIIDNSSFENLDCFQDNEGSIFTSVIGGTPFYTFNWTPNISSSPTANGLAAGNYSLQVVDQNGCTVNDNWVITEPNLLTGTPSQLDATCSFNNGTATITPSGGTIPYTYQWNDPNLQLTATATNLFAGNYLVNITDNNNCTTTQNYTILNESGPIIDSATFTPVSCFGGNDGTATVNLDPAVGTPPFNFSWNPSPQTASTINSLTAGSYSVVVTDFNGCITSGSVTVTEPPLLELFASQNDTICFGDTTQISGQGSGGTLPYTYNWTGALGLNPTDINNVFPVGETNYTVDITDNNNCTAGPVNVLVTILPSLNITAVDTFMCQGDSVEITAIPSGGNGNPYTYSWDNGSTALSQMVSPTLASSPMDFVITLNDGCSTPVYDTATVIVNPSPVIDSIVTTEAICYGDANGSATVFVNTTIAQAPFNYDWGFVSQPNPLVNGLSAEQYFVNITDNNGCLTTDSTTVNQPDSLILTANEDSVCFGATGQVSAFSTGGTAPYSYNWTNIPGITTGAGPHPVTPITTTAYTVSVTDINNCIVPPINVEVKVGQPLSLIMTDDEVCEDQDATISATASGGGAPYTFLWDNGVSTSTQTVQVNQNDTMFDVTLTDGCSTPVTATSVVIVNRNPSVSISPIPKDGCMPLAVDFIAVSDNGTEYYWGFGDGNTNFTTVGSTGYTYVNDGVYDVELTTVNAKGCSTFVNILDYVRVFPNPVADFSMNPSPISMLNPETQFTDLSYNYIDTWDWNFSGYGSSSLQNPSFKFLNTSKNVQINLIVTDTNGCIDNITKTLIVKPDWAFYMPNSFTPDGDDLNDKVAPTGFGIEKDDYSFYVFNRWGELLFETHILFAPWDGIFKGELLQQEAYVWKADFKSLDGIHHHKAGRILLVK